MTDDVQTPRHAPMLFAVETLVPAGDAERLAAVVRERWAWETVQIGTPHSTDVQIALYFDSETEAQLAHLLVKPLVPGRPLQIARIEGRDWVAAYRDSFQPREIGTQLRICPEWLRESADQEGRITLWIDPGLSFGTGNHFTTAFCLEMIDQMWLNSPPQSVLDAGTGSGLLAIAAARLGCPHVVALENDPDVIPYARENAERNGVGNHVEFRRLDVRGSPPLGPFEAVCANLYGGLLIECAPMLMQSAKRTLILSGIREIEVDGVAETFRMLGGRETVRDGDGEWAGLVFRRDRMQAPGI